MDFTKKRQLGLGRYVKAYELFFTVFMILLVSLLNLLMLSNWTAPPNYLDTVAEVPSWCVTTMIVVGIVNIIVVTLLFVSTVLMERSWFTFRMLFWVVFWICSLLGVAYSNYFYCVLPVIGATQNPILSSLLRSVQRNIWALAMLFWLGVFIIYFHSVVAFAYFRNDFDWRQGFYCDTLWECFVTELNWGFRMGGGIGEVLPNVSREWPDYVRRASYDLSFFFLLSFFIMQVAAFVLGQSFTSLIDENRDREKMMRENCFICGLTRSVIEEGADFDLHVKSEHNPWSYVFFFRYLAHKDERDASLVEREVMRAIKRHNYDWVPLKKALCLKGVE